MIRFFVLFITMLVLGGVCTVQAAETVAVRLSPKDGYTRLVFDWQVPAKFSATQDSSGLVLTFDRAAQFDPASVSGLQGSRISALSAVSAPGAPLSVRIAMTPGSQPRYLAVGNRVIVDVMSGESAKTITATTPVSPPVLRSPSSAAPVEKKASPPAPSVREVAKTPAKTAETKSETKPEIKPEEKAGTKLEPKPAETAKTTPLEKTPSAVSEGTEKKAELAPADAAKAEEAPPAAEEPEPANKVAPHIVTLTLTEEAGLAVFKRNDNLWIVIDQPTLNTSPIMTGPTPELFPAFRREEIKGGVAFTTKIPQNANLEVYGEGGGLVWRVLITPQLRHAKPVALQRNFSSEGQGADGSVSWSLEGVRTVLDVPDTDIGDTLKVVTVDSAAEFAGPEEDFVDFTKLPSIVGLALAPKVDDLSIKVSSSFGAEISRPEGGLAISRLKDVNLRLIRKEITQGAIKPEETAATQQIKRIFDFDRWMMGGLQALGQNQRILMAGLSSKDQSGMVQDLLTLTKMDIANDRGQEAIGFLNLAADEMPAIAEGAEFKALRGAAYALSGKYELALNDFQAPELKEYTELDYWRAFTLAWLEDWQQAKGAAPSNYSVMLGYPKALLEKIGLKMAEVALRGGDARTAGNILNVLQKDRPTLKPWTVAGMDYLDGEVARQNKSYGKAKERWGALIKGKDVLHRVKAGLAMTLLQLETKEISRADAIDRLESLRYAWRGDELEAQINFMLGKLYLEDRRYQKGFGILKEAVDISPDSDISREIKAFMEESFYKLLMEDKDISALDSATVYEEFSELVPEGSNGYKLGQRLAERLVEADLLDRAAVILQHQVDKRLQGAEQAHVASRLAAIYLLNADSVKAIKALDVAKAYFASSADADAKDQLHKNELMRARALSKMNKTEEALALLSSFGTDPDVNSLRADIAWQAGMWEDAAEALQDLILDQAMDSERPPTQKQADLILNRAVALNLSGNRVALANMRQRYGESMTKTSRAKLFDVVTRPRQSALLADRETLNSIVSEVDIFKDFLESYRASESTSN